MARRRPRHAAAQDRRESGEPDANARLISTLAAGLFVPLAVEGVLAGVAVVPYATGWWTQV